MVLIRYYSHPPLHSPRSVPAMIFHPFNPPPPFAHTCSLGTKWILQSHLIGLHFRIQGHLECLWQNCFSYTELFLTVFENNVLCGKWLSCSQWTSDLLSAHLKNILPSVIATEVLCVFLFFFHTSHFGHFRRAGCVLATSSVPVFFLACLFLSLSCGWAKDNWVAVFDCNHSKSLSLESSTAGNTVPPLQESSAHFHYILRCSWRIRQSQVCLHMSNAQAVTCKPYSFYW